MQGNKEIAPATLNMRWGSLYRNGQYEQLEIEKREFYGNARYDEAHAAMKYCNQKYRY
jgi:hypothetical protein